MVRQSALLTGGTGFIGSRLVTQLLRGGWAVHVIVRPTSTASLLSSESSCIAVCRYDGSFESMREIVRQAKPDVVFHLASHFVSDHQTYEVQRLIESNVLFGTQLVEAMTLEGQCNLVNTGTSWQHYGGKDYCPANLYAATKQAFEDILEFYVEVRELRVISLKMFDTYGPGDSRNKLVNALLAAAKTGEKLLMSPGEQSIDLVHVDDVVQAFIRSAELLRSGSCIGHQRFGVSSGAPITVRTLVSECQRVLGIAIPVRWSGRPYRRREVMKPWSPQSVLPGWRPRISLAEGLATLSLGQVDSV